ncbi:hypothetical protein V3470_14160 [Flavobacterium oreochromis]|uniref:hypothetical protein n=1 Tax=Flavobacterium oreochromis TaxID=2906078 RepID=UPI001CE5E203|nr:hypothetical protein [Flavobacterium oreochromis]QYS87035.1 hypothetical protein JJC03_03430 [Flavobacterium oreochromis]
MKKIIILFLICCFTSCKEEVSSKITKKMKEKEFFWKNRTKNIEKNKTMKEYPIQSNISTQEKITNRIYIDNMECQFEIFVDDVLLFKLMGDVTKNGGGVTGDYDINQLLLTSGKHEVKVIMYPRFGKQLFGREGYVNLTFSSFKDRNLKTIKYYEDMNQNNGIHIDQLKKQWIEKWDHDNQVGYEGQYIEKTPEKFEGLPIYQWSRVFNANVSFNFDGWRKSVDLKKEEKKDKIDIKKELYEQYKLIYEIIKNKDINQYLNIVKEREDLITSCLYYSENEKKLRQEEFIKLIAGDEYELEPLFEETFQLEYQGYGKLAMLLHKADGEGIIRLKNKKNDDDIIFLDFRFQRKKKGDNLTVI